MAPILAAIASIFVDQGLGLLAGAVKGGGEKAVEFIEKKTGIDIKDVADPNTATQITPENIEALKSLESTERTDLARMGYADVASARTREVDVTKATGKSNLAMYLLAGVIVVGFFGLMICLMIKTVPEGNGDVAFMLFGSLIAAFTSVVQYFFGSSKGSSDKTAMIK